MFHWKHVPVIFPASFYAGSENNFNNVTDGNLFILPTFDELEEISVDRITGKTKRLNKQQLESIKREGKFEVESQHFPGKTHKWVLARWLQKGYKNSNESFYSVSYYINRFFFKFSIYSKYLKDIAKSLHLLIITAKNRFFSNKFSILQGLKAWRSGAYDIFGKVILKNSIIKKTTESLNTF